jgi:hypothetical protein
VRKEECSEQKESQQGDIPICSLFRLTTVIIW